MSDRIHPKVLRGGCWDSGAPRARVAYRSRSHEPDPSIRYDRLGFRLVEEVEEVEEVHRMTPKRAKVNQRGRTLWLNGNPPRQGQEVVIMAELEADFDDQPCQVKKGDPWCLVAWVEIPLPCISSCWIPAEWLDRRCEVA